MTTQYQGPDKNSLWSCVSYHGLLLWFLLSIPAFSVYAQTEVSGSLADSVGRPIGNATITYRVPGHTSVLGFTKSENDGIFRFSIRLVDLDSLQLDIRHLSYHVMRVMIPNRTTHHQFVLRAGDNMLEAVNVGNPPIFTRRDTL